MPRRTRPGRVGARLVAVGSASGAATSSWSMSSRALVRTRSSPPARDAETFGFEAKVVVGGRADRLAVVLAVPRADEDWVDALVVRGVGVLVMMPASMSIRSISAWLGVRRGSSFPRRGCRGSRGRAPAISRTGRASAARSPRPQPCAGLASSSRMTGQGWRSSSLAQGRRDHNVRDGHALRHYGRERGTY